MPRSFQVSFSFRLPKQNTFVISSSRLCPVNFIVLDLINLVTRDEDFNVAPVYAVLLQSPVTSSQFNYFPKQPVSKCLQSVFFLTRENNSNSNKRQVGRSRFYFHGHWHCMLKSTALFKVILISS